MQAATIALPSYDLHQPSYTSSHDSPSKSMYSSQQSTMSAYRSFQDVNGTHNHSSHHQHQQSMPAPPQIYTAVYSTVQVYEMEVNNVAVMRRRADSWLNATQILKVAGVDKGKRTKVLEKEILTGEHEKVQGGYGKYQGTWINYRRGREFCRQYGVEEMLRPLLDYDLSADGSGQPGNGLDTPTKEQAMAANRKRLYAQTQDVRHSQTSATGTFFSNLSPAASNAISAMNKAARLNTPPQRAASNARRPGSAANLSLPNSQESIHNSQNYVSSQKSMASLSAERSFNVDSAFMDGGLEQGYDRDEPPRKRMRGHSPSASNAHSFANGIESQSFIRDGSPTEPNESFLYRPSSQAIYDGDIAVALPPLPHPSDKATEDKQSIILDLFADLARTDYTNHIAFQQLSGADLDLPLDQSANTALHWAATLAKIPLMRLLLKHGASIFRGNIAGETPLMAAVQVNNCLDHTCFPDLLELLSPLIEIRDAKGRTILHHIAVASGIKGRAASSKYYLEALLEFLVRRMSSDANPSMDLNGSIIRAPINLMRFMSEMVNARDMAGNTALNLVARIGNRSIIRQLIEVQADPTIPNHKGLKPMDFGVEAVDPDRSNPASQMVAESPKSKALSKTDEVLQDIVPTLTTSMTQMSSQFSNEIRSLQERIDKSLNDIRDLSSQQKSISVQVESQQAELRARQERKQRIQNLRRAIGEIQDRIMTKGYNISGQVPTLAIGDADSEYSFPSAESLGAQDLAQLPDSSSLNAQVSTYNSLLASLNAHLTTLKARDTELEAKYRKIVSLCTNVPEEKVDSVLGQLVLAVESEPENDVGRVRDFLKRVEAVAAV